MLYRFLMAAALVCSFLSAQTQKLRTARVEEGLLPAVVLKGEALPRYGIRERMAYYKVPGVSVAVIDNFKIAWAKCYGFRDRERKLPVDDVTMFEAGSISKPVAAMGALWLVDQKRLDLDEDVNEKLKSWKVPENEFTAREKVTLRRLLSHSAGLTVHGFPGFAAGAAVPTVPQILDGAPPANTPAVRVDVLPGSKWRYSGGGYTVMQLLLSDMTGKLFSSYMGETVLRKIGMKRSTYEQPLPEASAGNAATAYTNNSPIAGRYHTYPEMAAAGLWTTPSDLARFGIEVMRSFQGNSNVVLTQAATRQMLTRQSGTYGLGFELEGDAEAPRFSHGGVDEGFEAMLVGYVKSGQGAVVMTNAQGGIALANEILRSIAAEYGWPDYKPKERAAISLGAEKLRKFAGTYESPMGEVQIAATEGGLSLTADSMTVPLMPESETRFFSLRDGFPDFEFERGEDGKVTGISGGGMRGRKVK